MAIDQKIIELVNAEIDSEISISEKRELEALLATNSEALLFHAEMSSLCKAMDSTESLEPPPDLKHAILQAMKPKPAKPSFADLLARVISVPALRFAGAFAGGIILTLSFVSSDKISRDAFDDVTGLVGTMSDSSASRPAPRGFSISRPDITGTVAVRKSGRLLVVDFDLVSHGPVDIVAGFKDKNIWFNGFAQLESDGASVAAERGRVTIHMEGKRRYALYLHDTGNKDATIDLSFIAAGNVIHEAQLAVGPVN
jgi:hypothetical protein